MENIVIAKTIKTPEVRFDYNSGRLLISGISIPEDTVEFYHSLIYWLTEYGTHPKPKTILDLKLEYFNTSTSVVLLNIFKTLCDIQNTEVEINWYYEDDDVEMEDVGKDYARIVEAKFNLVPVNSLN